MWDLATSQIPRHDPAHELLSPCFAEWHTAYDASPDVTTYEGVRG